MSSSPRIPAGLGGRALRTAIAVGCLAALVRSPDLAAARFAHPAPGALASRRQHKRSRPLTCNTRRGSTVFRSGRVRLLAVGPAPIEYQSDVTSRLMGCLKPNGRAFFLDFLSQAGDSNVGVLESPRAAAPFVAYAIQASDEIAGKYGQPSTSYIHIESVNLRTGKKVTYSQFVQQPDQQSTAEAAVPNLQVTTSGWIAWILSSAKGETLYAFDSGGRRILDTGSIDPKSLAVSGSTVTWTNAGVQRSATLGPPSNSPPAKTSASLTLNCPPSAPAQATLMVSGKLSPPFAGAAITVTYTPPSGPPFTHTATTDTSGGYTDSTAAGTSQAGTWTTQASYAGNSQYAPSLSAACSTSVM